MKALRVALLASMVTAPTRVALAQPSLDANPVPPPSESEKAPPLGFRHRALLGFSFGFVGGSTTLNGEHFNDGDSYAGIGIDNGGLDFGLEERFTGLISLAARARLSTWNYGWATTVGYKRTRWDLGLEPRLWLQPKGAPRVGGYAGIGSGVTLGSENPPPRRAYDERVEGNPGYYLSVCLGGTYTWEDVAIYAESSYAFHSTHTEATLEPRAPGVPRTVEERDYVDHSLLVSLGLAFGFGRPPE